MIRGRKFPALPCVLARNVLEYPFRIREMSRDGGGTFLSSSFLILNFLPVDFQVPDPCFLLPFPFPQSHSCLPFLLPSAPLPPSPSVFSFTPFLSSQVLYLVCVWPDQGKKQVELVGRRKKSRGTLQPSFGFVHQRWILQMKQGALTVPHLPEKGRVLFVLKYWGVLTSLYSILGHNVFWNGGVKAYR